MNEKHDFTARPTQSIAQLESDLTLKSCGAIAQ